MMLGTRSAKSDAPVLNYQSEITARPSLPAGREAIAAQRADAMRDLLGWSVVAVAVVSLLGLAWTLAQSV